MKHIQFIFLSILIIVSFGSINIIKAQDKPEKEYIYQTFKDTRVINTWSVETLQKGMLDVRIAHRFGDFISQWKFENMWTSFFGFDNAADVGFGVDYGITNNLMVGVHRTKGAGPLKSLYTLTAKYKFLSQTKGKGMPFSMAAAGSLAISTMWESSNIASLASFRLNGQYSFAYRMMYSLQVHMARKFGDILSLQISPTLVWRNLVKYDDSNALISAGVSAKIQVTKVLGIILDANLPFDPLRWSAAGGYQIPLGIGFEIDTGGHVFQFNFTNSAGIEPTDYIPNTTLNWLEGEFRIGFTISRAFRM
ncbi:DUF5777 family beta-barrel protein [Aureispira]|nr:DUF5777 family beta-barrel protein [Aureispira sp.]